MALTKKIHPDVFLKQKMKKEDNLSVPENVDFYEKMHNKIMNAIENTEVKKLSEWSKTWVFLEPGQGDIKTKSKFHIIK